MSCVIWQCVIKWRNDSSDKYHQWVRLLLNCRSLDVIKWRSGSSDKYICCMCCMYPIPNYRITELPNYRIFGMEWYFNAILVCHIVVSLSRILVCRKGSCGFCACQICHLCVMIADGRWQMADGRWLPGMGNNSSNSSIICIYHQTVVSYSLEWVRNSMQFILVHIAHST
jgi:hypothetical protein